MELQNASAVREKATLLKIALAKLMFFVLYYILPKKKQKNERGKRKMKNQKGITLIALVITVIVLLILAGVSISMVIGNNGILNQASIAGRNTIRGTEQEQVEMAFVAAKMRQLRGEITEIDATALATELKQFGLVEGTDFTVSKEGEILKVTFATGNSYPIENEIVKPEYNDSENNV